MLYIVSCLLHDFVTAAFTSMGCIDSYYSDLISSLSDNSHRLWQTVNKLLHRKSASSLPSSASRSLADSFFASFFTDKIHKLHLSISAISSVLSPHSPPPPVTPPQFSSFRPASESEISKLFLNCPNKQADSDPIPTWLLKKCSSVLVPTITNIVNLSLSSWSVPPHS